ncbi:Hypothetical_protein [Hexamita inflata]|uniref:Hypothetical_protein n=1 Tax=Hexamita inflata TaxID=28002 RepID=A0AA86TME7_9EUKA|nr:Hypothetical protein HINF_LOCUS10634 [Hexamita inflata]
MKPKNSVSAQKQSSLTATIQISDQNLDKLQQQFPKPKAAKKAQVPQNSFDDSNKVDSLISNYNEILTQNTHLMQKVQELTDSNARIQEHCNNELSDMSDKTRQLIQKLKADQQLESQKQNQSHKLLIQKYECLSIQFKQQQQTIQDNQTQLKDYETLKQQNKQLLKQENEFDTFYKELEEENESLQKQIQSLNKQSQQTDQITHLNSILKTENEILKNENERITKRTKRQLNTAAKTKVMIKHN